MGLLVIKQLFVCLMLSMNGCAGGPDEFAIGYGRVFAGDSKLSGSSAENYSSRPSAIRNDDSDIVTAELRWYLKGPRRVRVENLATPSINYVLTPVLEEPKETKEPVEPEVKQDPVEAAAETEELEPPPPGEISDTIEAFDGLNWWTQAIIGVLALALLWTQREKIGGLIPGTSANKAKKASKT